MKNKFTFSVAILYLITLVGIQSCKNEVEVFANEKDVTVIYGLLSASDAVHQIKVNRVFQGTEAVDVLANDPELSEYENIDVSLLELQDNGFSGIDTLNRWSFQEALITNKDSGVFYYPNQKIYELEQQLNSNYLYAVQVDKLDGSAIVESTTEMLTVIDDDMLTKPAGLLSPGPGLGLANTQLIDGEFEILPIEEISLEVTVPTNGKVVDVYLDFSYQERDLDFNLGDTITISYYIGQEVVTQVPTAQDIEEIELELNPTAFYNFIAGKVPEVVDGEDIFQRQPLDIPLTFRFVSGGIEFNTYLEVASPSTSLLETKPEYTNIINGVGLWSCRSLNSQLSKMSEKSIEYLVNGEITSGRRFCHYTDDQSDSKCYQ